MQLNDMSGLTNQLAACLNPLASSFANIFREFSGSADVHAKHGARTVQPSRPTGDPTAPGPAIGGEGRAGGGTFQMISPAFANRGNLLNQSSTNRQICDAIRFPSSDLRRYAARDSIFSEGEASSDVFEILQGAVIVLRNLSGGRRQILDIADAGRFIGLTARKTHDCSALALKRTLLYRHAGSSVHAGPHHGAPLTAAIYDEIHRLRDLATALGRKTAVERLASFLVALLDDDSVSPVEMNLPVSRPEIADHLGLALETVCRNFTVLKGKNLIRIRGGARLTILDPPALRQIAHQGYPQECLA
jgi:CRP/FNR family transcriptional regulator